MESLLHIAAERGYLMLFIVIFAEVIGLPVPGALALIAAGAVAASGTMTFGLSMAAAVGAMVLGDTFMYLVGRFTGWWLLGLLCRVSLHPDSCILRSADAFYKKGRMVLVFARFVPGINTLAAPLAGSMVMPPQQFYAFDVAGACLYTGAYLGVGYLLNGFVGGIERGYQLFGHYAGWAVGIGIGGYMLYRVIERYRTAPRGPVVRVQPVDVGSRLGSVAIFDVRSHGYYEKTARRIQGSVRLDPHTLSSGLPEMPAEKQIILYCTCRRDATSSRVARFLSEHGIQSYVLTGGLRAWKKAGLPLESVPEHELVALPTFS